MALDTSTDACSVALKRGDQIWSRFEVAPRQHAELILPMIDEVLAQANVSKSELDVLAFARGPGAFTGLRIAAGVIQGLGMGLDLPVVPISTLATLAQGAWRLYGKNKVLAGLDARLQEVYFAAYVLKDGEMRLVGAEQVSSVAQLVIPGESLPFEWFGAGSAWMSYEVALSDRLATGRLTAVCSEYDQELMPHAQDVAVLAEFALARSEAVDVAQAVPVYLRNNVAKKSIKQSTKQSIRQPIKK